MVDRWVAENEVRNYLLKSLFLKTRQEFSVVSEHRGSRDNRTDGETDVIYVIAPIEEGPFGRRVGDSICGIKVNGNCWSLKSSLAAVDDAVEEFLSWKFEVLNFEGYYDQLMRA